MRMSMDMHIIIFIMERDLNTMRPPAVFIVCYYSTGYRACQLLQIYELIRPGAENFGRIYKKY